jgi:hypothetical protein
MADSSKFEFITHSSSKYIFTRMQNIIWTTRGLGLPFLVESDSGNLLGELISSYYPKKPLVINFTRITEIDDHALDGFFNSIKTSNRKVIIIDGSHLFNRIDQLRKGEPIKISNDQKTNLIVLGNDKSVNKTEIETERKKVITLFKNDAVKNCLEKFPKKRRLSSTPLVATGEFNSNKLINDLKSFVWLSTFFADEVQDLINEQKIQKPTLLSASLRGAPFAAAIGMLLSKPYETIDHFGPKHKIFESDFINRIEKGTNYIFIGDFCIGGTEIKLAKMYTEMKGSFLNHAIVIGTQIDPEHFADYFKLYSLVNLSKLALVNYSI